MAISITVAGACGRMGQRILHLAHAADDLVVAGAVDDPVRAGEPLRIEGVGTAALEIALASDVRSAIEGAEVLIDFSIAEAALANAQAAAAAGVACVIGTTGVSSDAVAELPNVGGRVPIVYAPNMSVGVNLLFQLVRLAAKALPPEYNIEVVEVHHNQKKDSPSGTAVRLAERAAEARGLRYDAHTKHGREGTVGARPIDEIGVHAVRGGDVVGDHTVSFFGPGERIELGHRAHSRDTFAAGALTAARFAAKAAPGLYDMQDVLGLR